MRHLCCRGLVSGEIGLFQVCVSIFLQDNVRRRAWP